jgi:hypothetical protein
MKKENQEGLALYRMELPPLLLRKGVTMVF